MKSRKIVSFLLVVAMLVSFLPMFDFTINAEAVSETDREVIGYGYNVTGGKSLSKSSLLYRNPILDVNNTELMSRVVVSNYLENKSENLVAESAQEIASMMNSSYSAGINGKIGIVNIDVGAAFDKGQAMTNAVKERYEVYYQSIARRQIVLQMSISEMRDYLSPTFLRDAASIKDVEDAVAFMTIYGTHLFTGYTLGGRLEVTNYKVTSSASVDLNQTVDLKAQVGAAAAAASGGLTFSITEQYGSYENTENQRSVYNFTSVGGEAVAALTIDHLFTYNSSMLDGKGNYEYARWAYAINEGKNLDILGAATGTSAVPVWELLPLEPENSGTRELLVTAYALMCGEKYQEFKEKYPYLEGNFANNSNKDSSAEIVEYMTTLSDVVTGPHSVTKGGQHSVIKGSKLYLSAIDTSEYGDSSWIIYGGEGNASVLDPINGVVEVTGAVGNTFSVALTSGDQRLDVISFKIVEQKFSGGLGTKDDPYLIGNVGDLQKLLNTPDLFTSASNYYLLVDDIDASTLNITRPMSKTKAFAGVFDGGYHTISGYISKDADGTEEDVNPYPSSSNTEVAIGIFGYNKGTIKNLKIDHTEITVKDSARALYSVVSAGVLVGINNGTIQNCVVQNSTLHAKKAILSSDSAATSYYIYAGGLVGQNTGTIDRCGVVYADVVADLRLQIHTHLKGYAASGALVGLHANTGVIKSSYTLMYDPTKSDDRNNRVVAQVYGGGSNSETGYTNETNYSYAYVGGLIGWTTMDTSKPKVENCIVDVPSRLLSYVPGSKNHEKLAATLVGCNEGLDGNVNCISDCYVLASSMRSLYYDAPNIMATVTDGVGKNIITAAADTLSFVQSISYSALEDYISDDIWCADESDRAVLIDMATTTLSMSKVNTDYSFGNYWSPIGINLTLTMKNGKTVNPVAWKLDNSGYDPEKLGSYSFVIRNAGLSTAYTVSVDKCDILSIVASDKSTDALYSETVYDYTTRDLSVMALLSNGHYVDLYSGEKLDYVNYKENTDLSIISELLGIGINTISVRYGNLSTYYNVNALENLVEKIEIVSQPTKKKYRVGSNFSSEGMCVKATYSNGMERIIEGSELSSLEIIGGAITYGDNVVIISYGDYKTQQIKVEGYSPLIMESAPDKTKYYIGDEIDWTGCVLTYTLDGESYIPVDLADCTFSTSSISKEGTNTVTVSYGAMSTTFDFTGLFKYVHQYTVTFVGFGGAVLLSVPCDEGAQVVAPTVPEVEGYTFTGWSHEIIPATGNAVYTAIYEKIVVVPNYAITFVGHNGVTLRSNVYSEGSDVEPPIAPSVNGYKFVGWDKEVTKATKNEIYVAVYEAIPVPSEYAVIFVGHNGVTLRSNIYTEGSIVTPPTAPKVDGYTFVGWDKEISPVTKSEIYVAVYDEIPVAKEYTVVFVGHNGVTLRSNMYTEGTILTPPIAPTVDGYTFLGWDKEISPVTKNEVYVAVYEGVPTTKEYFVMFVGHNGVTLLSNMYTEGTTLTAPTAPKVDGYTFVGWDKDITPVTKNEVYVAVYDKISAPKEYSITFVGFNGIVLRGNMYTEGSAVTPPVAPAVDGYTFLGWDKDITAAYNNEIYVAVYQQNAVVKEHLVIFVGHNGLIISSGMYDEGSVIAPPTAPTVSGYTFRGWDAQVVPVSGNAVYTAVYTKDGIADSILAVADANGDGLINNSDVALIIQHIHFNDITIYATGDVNGDGKLTTDDALYLKNYLISPKDYPINA